MDTHRKQKSKMPGVATIVPTVTHRGGILSNSTKGRLSDPIKRPNSTTHCLQRTHFTSKDFHRLKVKKKKKWESVVLKKARAFIASKTDFYQ